MEKTLTGKVQSDGAQGMSQGRRAAWAAAAFLLLLPLVAMQFTSEVNWSAGDFVFAGVLLFGSLGAYELVVRATGDTAYRAGVGIAVAGAFLLVWSNAAVGITDTDADAMYLVVLAVGVTGAFVAQFRPAGMARAMLATALAMEFVSVLALVLGKVAAYNSPLEILGITGFFVTLFAGSALLFQASARAGAQRDAA